MACRLVGAKPFSEPIMEYWYIRTLKTNFSEILSKIHAFSFKKMHLKMSSAKWLPFCLGLNVLTGELWGVPSEEFGENWPCYTGTSLYKEAGGTVYHLLNNQEVWWLGY